MIDINKIKKASEGVVIYTLGGFYEAPQNKFWAKAKRQAEIDGIVVSRNETKTPNVFNYDLAVGPISDELASLIPKYVWEYQNKKYMKIGRSDSTSIKVNVGSILRVAAEEVLAHETSNPKFKRYAGYVMRVLEPVPEKDIPDSLNVLDRLSQLECKRLPPIQKEDLKFPEFVWIPDFVSLCGSIVYRMQGRARHEPNDVDIVVRAQTLPDGKFMIILDPAFRLKLDRLIELNLGKKDTHYVPSHYGPNWANMPLYDLVLRPKEKFEIREVDEPEFADLLYKESASELLEKLADPYMEYLDEDKEYRYIIHAHWRGVSVHNDFRFEDRDKNELIGWTMDIQIKGVVKDPVNTLEEAEAWAKKPEAWKIDWTTGKVKERETSGGQIRPAEIVAQRKPKEPCIAEDSFVIKNQTIVPARDIVKGDLVYTISGEFKKVLHVDRNITKVNQVLIKPKHGLNIQVDAEHPFLVQGNHIPTFEKLSHKARILAKLKLDPHWVKASDLENNDILLFSKPKLIPNPTLKGFDWGRLIGFFLGDGSFHRTGRRSKLSGLRSLEFRLHVGPSKDLAMQYTELLKRLNIHSWINSQGNCWTIHFRVNKQGLAPIFLKCYKDNSKHFPLEYCLSSDENFRHGVLQGLIESDGYIGSKGEFHFCNANPSIINGTILILSSFGKLPSIKYRKNLGLGNMIYELSWSNRRSECFDYGDFIGTRIRSVQTSCPPKPLVNIVTEDHTVAFPYCISHNTEWINIERVFERGQPGSTRFHRSVFYIIDKGTIETGAQTPQFHEYFLSGGKLKGRVAFRLLAHEAMKDLEYPSELYDDFPETSSDIDKAEPLPPGEPVEKPRDPYFWVFIQPIDQTPYSLSKRALEKAWLPPKGISALPKAVREKVPEDLRYWEAKTRDSALEKRKLLMERLDSLGLKQERLEKAETHDFILQWHYWKKTFVIRETPSTQHWDLRIKFPNEIFHLVLAHDPTEETEVSGYEKECRDPNAMHRGLEGPEKLKPSGHAQEGEAGYNPYNPTINTWAWIEALDHGKVKIFERSHMFMRAEFSGKSLKGIWEFKRENSDSNFWMMKKIE